MDTHPLAKLQTLSSTDKTILKRSEITSLRQLLLLSASDLSKRCNIVYKEAQRIIDTVCEELAPELRLYTLDDPEGSRDLTFTTGDPLLDKCLGGGIMTGRIWEIVGESGAGKSQLCMQMLYTVQLPRSRGGIAGASCLLTTTSSERREKRLNEILSEHPSLSASQCSTSDIHFMKAFTVPKMIDALSKEFPRLVTSCAEKPFSKPIKLLVIDALAELFHEHETTNHNYLKQRAESQKKPITIRKLTVIFNTLASSASLHYIVTTGGIMALPPEDTSIVTVEAAESPPNSPKRLARSTIAPAHTAEISPLDLPFADVTEPETGMFSELPSSSAEPGSQPTLVADSAEDGPQGDDDENYLWKAVDERYGSDFDYYTQ
ncbi:hypothetical protein EIP86_002257 [Pleurotus ostreatoroseus]|nr:hypothetical protein EIP86_002257 [Pleurotus ostreatoroseus]